MLSEAHGIEAMKKSRVYEWYKWFKEDRENVERNDLSRPHRTEENVKKVRNLVNSVTFSSIIAMAAQPNLDKETVT
jgi:hypothetical protein